MNTYLSAVNQKFFFSKLLLKHCRAAENRAPYLEVALCQSALYHLECAYRHYLREVAATYKCPVPADIDTVSELIAALKAVGKHPAEAVELDNLEADADSWLRQMLATHQALARLPEQASKPDLTSPIAVMQVQEDVKNLPIEYAAIKGWCDAFEELFERQREMMIEC